MKQSRDKKNNFEEFASFKFFFSFTCFKVMTPSGWNPPPGYRKLHGDLLYLQVLYCTVPGNVLF